MGKIIWKPSDERIKKSNMYRFMNFINEEHNLEFDSYESLYKWSIEHIPEFWATIWKFSDIKASSPYEEIISDIKKMPGAVWFSGSKLNFAENLLSYRDNTLALIFKGEDQKSIKITYKKLYQEVASIADSLKLEGVKAGDRVVGFMPNMPETIIAMLAATSLGAIWSSCSPDFGKKTVLDRFGQIQPKILFTANGYSYKGKKINSLPIVSYILKEIHSVERVIVVPYTEEKPDISNIPNAILINDFKSKKANLSIEFEQFPFNHPLYIMYSSGTTGLPKCMVQSAGGILINHLKELILHTDVKREDKLFYFTTCGWMMWNWLVSGLAIGATLVLYDGNPFYPDAGALWRLAQDEKISIFGTSAGYITALQKSGIKPLESYDLTDLKTILSTGSPLPAEGFEFIYSSVKSDLQLSSISGGTDLNGCFALGNPMGPVYAGELQCRGLAMKVESYDENGGSVINNQGELVCTAPFPSMPLYFWDDPENEQYHNAYFNLYENIWRHGDYIEINKHGGIIIYGRSDATLNPGGVRIGTADIYRQVEQFEEIEDSLVVGQNWKNDERVILFVKLAPGAELTDTLVQKIRETIRTNTTPRHVPAKIISIPDIPYTLNMKKVEIAVKKTIHNQPVKNTDALKNPEALDCYANLAELKEE